MTDEADGRVLKARRSHPRHGFAAAFFLLFFHGCSLGIGSAIEVRDWTAAPPSDHSWTEQVKRRIIEREYEASRNHRGLQAPNRAHGLRTYFTPRGIEVEERLAHQPLVSLTATRFGRGGDLALLDPGEVSSEGARVEIRRPGFTEWFENSARGLEQGFTVAASPRGDGPLLVELSAGDATATVRDQVVYFTTPDDRRLRYGGLLANDATGRLLPSRFETGPAGAFRIAVEDAGAVYPVVIDPLLSGTSDTEILGAGIGVNGAGDIDGDGYDDLVIGHSHYDGGEVSEGAVFFFLGGPDGIASGDRSTADAIVESDVASAFFGGVVSGIGDINGDGFDDVGISSQTGPTYVFLGSPDGIPSGNLALAATSLTPGGAIAPAGDVNGDGYDDFVIAATSNARIYHGSATGVASGGPEVAATRIADAAQVRWKAVGAGDVDGDGYDDLLVGIAEYSVGELEEGAAFVFRGGPEGIPDGGTDSAATRLESNQTRASFGSSVAPAGDLDDDGYSDIAVGAYLYDGAGADEGAAFVFAGSQWGIPSGGLETASARILSGVAGARFGAHVGPAGDVDSDGFDDLLVSAYSAQPEAVPRGIYLFTGSASGMLARRPEEAAHVFVRRDWYQLGIEPARAVGDVDGDGFDDIAIGIEPFTHGLLEVLLYRGGVTFGKRLTHGGQQEAWFGYSVDGAGDVDGDGFDDVIVGAPGYDAGEVNEGAAFLFHGRPGGPATTLAGASGRIESDEANSFLGESVSGAGDVDGDGFADVIVSARGYGRDAADPQAPYGAGMIFHGGPEGVGFRTPASADAILSSDLPGSQWALQVDGVGDVNGDGYDDIGLADVRVLASTEFNLLAADAFLFLGRSGGIPTGSWNTAATHFEPVPTNLPVAVRRAGDVNGDGFDDVAIGAAHGVHVYHGETGGIPSGEATSADTFLRNDDCCFGVAVSAAGDVDADGYDDLLVGSPDYTEDPLYSIPNSGAFLFRGGPEGIPSGSKETADDSFLATEAGSSMGSAVAGIGDVDRDGYDDVIVAQSGWRDPYSPNRPEAAFVYLGGPDGFGTKTELDADLRIDPVAPFSFQAWDEYGSSGLGRAVAGAGDVNGDGYADFVVGGSLEWLTEYEEGTARVVLPEPRTDAALLVGLVSIGLLARRRSKRLA